MYVLEESDCAIVPMKLTNNEGKTSAEPAEGRAQTKENDAQPHTHPTQGGVRVSQGLGGVRQKARSSKQERFTALLHHLTIDLLRESYYALQRSAAPGVDGVSWQQYEQDLDSRLADLHSRVHRGAYRAQPSRRVYIPKTDGRQRPLGIAALEDKIVQQAVVTILNQIYEVDFQGFSYGFRPGRSPHQALDALTVGIQRKRVNWVLDADIRGFFDNLSHEWTMKFIEHRVADRRILRLIRKWLKAGVSEDGQWSETKLGTPQGAVASPLIANVPTATVMPPGWQFAPIDVTGKVPVHPATSTVFVQVLIAFVVLPSVCFRISFRKYAAEAQSSASEIHEMRDAWNPNVSVPPRTPDGTMSFELLIAACSSMVKSTLPLVRAYS